jgi:predicted nucleotidyltransferase
MHDIRAFARRIVAEFKPQRIVLFGSHAYGQPNADSDVDLLVVMPYHGHPARTAGAILTRTSPSFAVDLLVRSREELRERYRLKDWFVREIIDKGIVLYEAAHRRVGRKGRGRPGLRAARVSR